MKKTVLYGLAGNPPHIGHWGCVRDLVQRGYFVMVSPSAGHAFGKIMAPFDHRLSWIEMGLQEFCSDLLTHVQVWGGEVALRERLHAETVYSIDVLRALSLEYPDRHFELGIGPDNAVPEVFSRFKEHQAIKNEFGVVVTPEQGMTRSTAIREALSELQNKALLQRRESELKEVVKACVGEGVFRALEALNFKIEGGYQKALRMV